ncbi:carbon-nitrogen hydrolase family protein [Psychromicrobium xiongbiense]|uniref:carbon-nitrogen hydrolase family protein n=1 Tax=Psychromicrobium xiongbiense TaxID=3051184 RepID=UPI002554F43A|nr:carbon-nitrogen hydrolase family protein [Psychromicrobium sp. YIM S02556]
MKVSVAQFSPEGVVEGNLQTIRELVAEAAAEGSQLVLLPEEAMFSVGQVEGDFRQAVEADWTTFVQQLTLIAAEFSVAIIAGGYEPSNDERPYNTLVAVAEDGSILGTYRKLHLYDAFSYQESRRIMPGDGGLSTVRIGEFTVGMMTCYDLRFPELARALAEEGVDLLCIPAAWFKGEHKIDHWETLLKARAIENTYWVAAAGSTSAHCIGHSAIVDPMGVPMAYLNEEPVGLVSAEVTIKRIEEVREFLPVLKNRRLTSVREIVPAH